MIKVGIQAFPGNLRGPLLSDDPPGDHTLTVTATASTDKQRSLIFKLRHTFLLQKTIHACCRIFSELSGGNIHRGDRTWTFLSLRHRIIPDHSNILRYPYAPLHQCLCYADCHQIIGTGNRLRQCPAIIKQLLHHIPAAVIPIIPIKNLILPDINVMLLHTVKKPLQSLLGMCIITRSCQIHNILDSVFFDQMRDHPLDRMIMIQHDIIVLVALSVNIQNLSLKLLPEILLQSKHQSRRLQCLREYHNSIEGIIINQRENACLPDFTL